MNTNNKHPISLTAQEVLGLDFGLQLLQRALEDCDDNVVRILVNENINRKTFINELSKYSDENLKSFSAKFSSSTKKPKLRVNNNAERLGNVRGRLIEKIDKRKIEEVKSSDLEKIIGWRKEIEGIKLDLDKSSGSEKMKIEEIKSASLEETKVFLEETIEIKNQLEEGVKKIKKKYRNKKESLMITLFWTKEITEEIQKMEETIKMIKKYKKLD